MEIIELKISKKQFTYINKLMYNTEAKNRYIIENIIRDKYILSPDVHFSTYNDSLNCYLFFEGEEKDTDKIKIFDINDIISND